MMNQENINICGRDCRIYDTGNPFALLIQPTARHEADGIDGEVGRIATDSGVPFAMAMFEVKDWSLELTPWHDPAISRKAEVGLHADDTLEYVKGGLLPWLHQRYGELPCIMGGYSLGALFSLWAACETNNITGVAAASPSVWIHGWLDYARKHQTNARQVYMSLGDKEEKVKNQAIAQVGGNIRQYYSMLLSQLGGDRTILEWNEGNHFHNEATRTARAFAWNLTHI